MFCFLPPSHFRGGGRYWLGGGINISFDLTNLLKLGKNVVG